MLRNTRKTIYFLCFSLFLGHFWACDTKQKNPQNNGVQINLDQLLGRWVAIDNPNNIIELTKNRMYSFHGELKLADESLMIYQNCVSKCVPEGMETMPCLVTDGKMAENCFKLIELTDKKLTYALIGEAAKPMTFKRL